MRGGTDEKTLKFIMFQIRRNGKHEWIQIAVISNAIFVLKWIIMVIIALKNKKIKGALNINL